MFIGSNASVEELINYGNLPQEAIDALHQLAMQVASLEKQVAEFKHAEDVDEDMAFQARELLDNIEAGLEKCTSAKQARAVFVRCCENGYFER